MGETDKDLGMQDTQGTAAESGAQGQKPSGGIQARLAGLRSPQRMFERAAVMELKAAQKARYRQEDAADQAAADRMRRERNEEADLHGAREWDLAVAREMASAERYEAYNAARGEAIEAKRAAKVATKEALAAWKPAEEARRTEMREEVLAEEEAALAARQAAVSARIDAMIARHEAWDEARGRAVEAKRAMKAVLRSGKAQGKAARAARAQAEDAAREERNAAEEERGTRVRALIQKAAVAQVDYQDARRTGKPDNEVEQLRATWKQLVEEAQAAEAQARAERMAVEDALVAQRMRQGMDDAAEQSRVREAWRAAHDDEVRERRRVRKEDRAARKAERAESAGAEAALREKRNARAKVREDESRRLNTERELMLADLRAPYIEARAQANVERRAAKAADKPARAEALATERAVAGQHRGERLAREQEQVAEASRIARERVYTRSLDREAAQTAAQEAWHQMLDSNSAMFKK